MPSTASGTSTTTRTSATARRRPARLTTARRSASERAARGGERDQPGMTPRKPLTPIETSGRLLGPARRKARARQHRARRARCTATAKSPAHEHARGRRLLVRGHERSLVCSVRAGRVEVRTASRRPRYRRLSLGVREPEARGRGVTRRHFGDRAAHPAPDQRLAAGVPSPRRSLEGSRAGARLVPARRRLFRREERRDLHPTARNGASRLTCRGQLRPRGRLVSASAADQATTPSRSTGADRSRPIGAQVQRNCDRVTQNAAAQMRIRSPRCHV
jgi:hypothetical protein